MYKNPLFDTDFLLQLDTVQDKILYARITSLTWDESPLEYIEGQITGGSINIDGASTLRRTCSLSMVAQNIDINSYYWGLNTKFKLEIGLQNIINPNYPDIIWFPQGIFVFTTFNTSISINSYTINISGKDKMCLLNGDISGNLNSPIDFGVEEYYDKTTKTITYNNIPIKDIIKNIVHVYGNEPLHNIIINDIDDYGYELLSNYGDTDIFLFKKLSTGIFTNMTLSPDHICYLENNVPITIKNLPQYDLLMNMTNVNNATKIKMSDQSTELYTVAKIAPGEVAGYRLTDLTYAGDLIAKVGESITSILDKIKKMLGTFEYFYDVDGHFIFQKQKVYTQGNFSLIYTGDSEHYVIPAAGSSEYAYEFANLRNFTAISNTPALNNLKNDFSVWGEREGVSGAKIPILLRYALDHKPTEYNSIENNKIYTIKEYDWREIIYQMAIDYFKHNQEDTFLFQVAAANPINYPSGYTGYEQYYTDIQGFWRQLYNPDFKLTMEPDISLTYYQLKNNKYVKVENAVKLKSPSEDITYYDINGNEYTVFSEFNPNKTYYIKEDNELVQINIYQFNTDIEKLYTRDNDEDYDPDTFWNYDVLQNPGVLNFWFDFIGEDTALERFSVSAIGSRTKAMNDKDVRGIYFKETPSVLFVSGINIQQQLQAIQSGYTYINITEPMQNMFNISSQGKSAFNTMEELLYQNIYCSESISITSLPIFYLQPNVKIKVFDKQTNIDGDYLISKISLSLAHNGTMAISATKVAESLY